MIEKLERQQLDEVTKGNLRRAFALGPWAWPDRDAHPFHYKRAQDVVGGGDAPRASPGEVLLCSVSDSTASLWVLRTRNRASPVESRELGTVARRAWVLAGCALPRSLPILWSATHGSLIDDLVAERLYSVPRPGRIAEPERLVDGPSFGLSFFLALASRALAIPVEPSLAATGEVEPWGGVLAIDHLREKIAAIQEMAPGIRRFLVPAAQAGEATDAVKSGGRPIEIIPVRSAAEAAGHAFGHPQALARLIVQRGDEPEARRRLASAFFRLAIAGRKVVLDWTPVARAARLAFEEWKDLPDDERAMLELVRAVAARHEGINGAPLTPREDWLERLPAPVRLAVVANWVQQAADTGLPDAGWAEQLARRHFPEPRDAYGPHTRLKGALGRLLAVAGRPQEAMALQEAAAREFFACLDYAEISFPLSEWFRLAGDLGDGSAFDRAATLLAEVEQLEGFDAAGRSYVDLGKARAAVGLGRELGHPILALRGLMDDPTAPAHVRWSSVRWLIRALESQGGSASEISARRRGLQKAACGSDNDATAAKCAAALVELDSSPTDGHRVADALGVLAEDMKGLVRMLDSWRPTDTEPGQHIRRWWPY